MAFDAFLKIDGIDGESTDAQHQGWIDILSFQWGVGRGLNSPTGGAASLFGGFGNTQQANTGGALVPAVQSPPEAAFRFLKLVDSASPQIFLKLADGAAIKQATLTCRKAGGDQTSAGALADFLKITFSDVLVSGFTDGGQIATDPQPMEQVSLNFTKIEIDVVGPQGTPVSASADLFVKH
ncbi:MAG: type VI secretion system tube protein Hcp [Verrucomicrobia bacterium]|nr:type VI secretion system tube protein Hcp [Verrucomicrobiota bacterium]